METTRNYKVIIKRSDLCDRKYTDVVYEELDEENNNKEIDQKNAAVQLLDSIFESYNKEVM